MLFKPVVLDETPKFTIIDKKKLVIKKMAIIQNPDVILQLVQALKATDLYMRKRSYKFDPFLIELPPKILDTRNCLTSN